MPGAVVWCKTIPADALHIPIPSLPMLIFAPHPSFLGGSAASTCPQTTAPQALGQKPWKGSLLIDVQLHLPSRTAYSTRLSLYWFRTFLAHRTRMLANQPCQLIQRGRCPAYEAPVRTRTVQFEWLFTMIPPCVDFFKRLFPPYFAGGVLGVQSAPFPITVYPAPLS